MKKFLLVSLGTALSFSLLAQDTTIAKPVRIDSVYVGPTPVKRKAEKINLAGRSNDHLLIQYGYAGWNQAPDSMNIKGLSHSLNFYFMFDFPFKSNPHLSVGIGPGIASDAIKFKKTYVGIASTNGTMPFTDQTDTNHFKKTKLVTTYLEAPVELRFSSNPLMPGKSFKAALGVKVGTMINAHTRNKTFQSASGGTLNEYSMKESSKRYFNTTRIVGSARVGYGHFSLYGTYQFTNLFKDGVAAEVHPFSIGLTLSGL